MKRGALAFALVCALGACRAPVRSSGRGAPRIDVRASAIERGLAYLRAHPTDASALAVLDYLQRKYALDPALAFERTWSGRDDAVRGWGRIVGRVSPGAGPLEPLGPRPDTEQLVERALYCDRLGLPLDFGEQLSRYVAEGRFEGYELTHAALVLKLLDDNRCTLDGPERTKVSASVVEGTMGLLKHPSPRRDVQYEALAIVQDLLARRDLDDEWFRLLLEDQQQDGGWAARPDSPSAPHATVLAVWALLAREHPDAPDVRFARQ